MIFSRWDRPGPSQSAQACGPLSRGPRARVARCRQCSSDIHGSRGAHTCFRMRGSRMVHYGPHQAVSDSDATPRARAIARGNTPLTIPILQVITRGDHNLAPIRHNPTLPYWYHPDFVFRSSVVSFRIRLKLEIRTVLQGRRCPDGAGGYVSLSHTCAGVNSSVAATVPAVV
jgi:hypothetical protein